MLSKPLQRLLAVLVLLTGCFLPARDRIDKIWFFTYYTGVRDGKDSVLTPASFLNLQKDGSYTSDLGEFEYGLWRLDDKTLYLNDYRNKITHLKIEYLVSNEMRISSEQMPAASFEGQPGEFKTGAENPFAKENNAWRIKPLQKENDAELKIRLVNHMKFWEKYFSWALTHNINSIDVRSTPTPIKVYGNGFALKPFADLPKEWKTYFFDEDDCKKANEMIKTAFDTHDIAWAHTENKYKLFISAFQQLQQILK